MWVYLSLIIVMCISFFVGRNSKRNGYHFWRSFIFMMLLGVVIMVFLIKQFYGA